MHHYEFFLLTINVPVSYTNPYGETETCYLSFNDQGHLNCMFDYSCSETHPNAQIHSDHIVLEFEHWPTEEDNRSILPYINPTSKQKVPGDPRIIENVELHGGFIEKDTIDQLVLPKLVEMVEKWTNENARHILERLNQPVTLTAIESHKRQMLIRGF